MDGKAKITDDKGVTNTRDFRFTPASFRHLVSVSFSKIG